MTAAVLLGGAVAALLLFALTLKRLQRRFGPVAGAFQAALLAGALALVGVGFGLRTLVRPSAPPPTLFALVGEGVLRENPGRLRAEFARMPKGTPLRIALFSEGARATHGAVNPVQPLAPAQPEARFSSLAAALAWAGIEGRESSAKRAVVFSQRGVPATPPTGMAVTSVALPPAPGRASITRFVFPPSCSPTGPSRFTSRSGRRPGSTGCGCWSTTPCSWNSRTKRPVRSRSRGACGSR